MNSNLQQTHVPNFGRQKDLFNEIGHLRLNPLRPLANKITESPNIFLPKYVERRSKKIRANSHYKLEHYIHQFNVPVRERVCRHGGLEKKYHTQWNEAKYGETNETFDAFLKSCKKTVKQAFGNKA